MTLQQLIARRSELKAELERIEQAIASFSDATPVKIGTRRNLRNTGWLSIYPQDVREGEMLVFSDSSLTVPADRSDQGGWVIRSAWATFQLEHPEMIEFSAICEEK